MQTKKITLQELILLIMMTICFAATIVFLFFDHTNFALMTFCLHSILVMILFFLFNAHFETRADDLADAQNAEIIADYLEEITRLGEENAGLKGDLEKLRTDLDAALSENASLLREADEAGKRMPESKQHAPMLLPSDENPQALDLIASCREVMDEMRHDCQKHGVSLQLSTDCDSLMIRADAAFIRIMLRNIIDNSVKYMKRNGSLVITVSHIGEDLFIVLKDNGEGLSSMETEHIFELNYQGSNRISGNGLGLTQAKAIVDYYGGTIYAKSGAGKGMAIYIQLPAESK